MIQVGKTKIEESLEGDKRWFVLSTQWRQEKLALENLQRQGFEAYLPLHLVEVKPKGQPARVISLPLFPRYLFCQVDLGVTGWRSIYGTRGVQGVLPCEAHGSKVLARLIADIQAREVRGLVELTPAELPCRYQPGDRVTYGVVRDAVFCERVDEKRCAILVSLLGRDSRQIVDLADLE